MLRLLLAVALLVVAPLEARAAEPAPVWSRPFAGGTLVRYDAFPSTNVDPRTVYVWTPRGYEAGRDRYDVLYMADGQNLFLPEESYGGKTWRVAEHLQALIDQGRARPAIIVGVWNAAVKRGREYAPEGGLTQEARKLLEQDWGGPLLSDRYLAFLTTELKPFVDRTYRTEAGRRHTFLMGSSMGGLISLYGVVKRPDVFGGAAALSTHWPIRNPADLSDLAGIERVADGFLGWLDAKLPSPDQVRLYFDHGTVGLDAYYGPFQARMNAIAKAHGFVEGETYLSLVAVGGDHNEAAWEARLDGPLLFLLGTGQ